MWVVKQGRIMWYVCVCVRGRERGSYTYEQDKMGDDWLYWKVSSSYKNTHNEVYIELMCKSAHVWGEYRYKNGNPILNELGSGGSRMYHS